MRGRLHALYLTVQRLRRQLFAGLFGLLIGSGGLALANVCPSGGQCGSCGACLVGLPLIALLIYALKQRRRANVQAILQEVESEQRTSRLR